MATVEKQRTIEEIQADLEAASKAYSDLIAELGDMRQRLKDEAKADRGALTAAAMSGTLKSAKTPKLDQARERAGELPYLIWAAELAKLQLEEEYAEAKSGELQEQVREAYAIREEAEAAFEEARIARDAAAQEHAWAVDELRNVTAGDKHRRGRIAELEESGPNV